MTLSGPIPLQLEGQGRAEDCRHATLGSAWLIRDTAQHSISSETKSAKLVHDAESVVAISRNSPALIILSEQVPATAKAARHVIQSGERLYLLAPANWSNTQPPNWLAQAAPTQVLIRRVREAPVAAVLLEQQGWAWTGPAGPGPWRLALNSSQIEALRLAFLRLYWDEADDEGWPEHAQVVWRARGQAPFDIPKPAENAAVHLVRTAVAQPGYPGSQGCWYAPDFRLPEGPADRIWAPASGEVHETLSARLRSGSKVVWSNLKLPLCWTGSQPAMMPQTEHWSLPLYLDKTQATALENLLRQPPRATFETDITLAAAEHRVGLQGCVWLPNTPQPQPLIKEQVLNAGTSQAPSLRAAPGVAPDNWPSPSVLALSATWHWKVLVPTLPKGAKPDPLIKRWKDIDSDYTKRTEGAFTTLAEVEKHEGLLLRTYESLKSALLGFGRSRASLKMELESSSKIVLSDCSVDKARQHAATLLELEERVKKLEVDVNAAEARAYEKAERKRQEEEHQKKQKSARARLADLEKELAEEEERLQGVDQEFVKLAPMFKEMSRKDRKAAQKKLRNDQQRFSKRVRALEGKVEAEQAVCDKPFEFKPPHRKKAGHHGLRSFVPKAPTKQHQNIPDEELPRTGELFLGGKSRFLAITHWEHLEHGEAEARRLGASLVAAAEDDA